MCRSIFTFLLFMLNVWQAQTQTIDIIGPAGSGQFGKTVLQSTSPAFIHKIFETINVHHQAFLSGNSKKT